MKRILFVLSTLNYSTSSFPKFSFEKRPFQRKSSANLSIYIYVIQNMYVCMYMYVCIYIYICILYNIYIPQGRCMFIQISRLGMLVSKSQPAYRLKMSKWPVVAYTHTHTQTHTNIWHVYNTHIYTHTYIHTYIHSYIHIHTCIQTSIHTCMHTCIHAYRGVTFPALRACLNPDIKIRGLV